MISSNWDCSLHITAILHPSLVLGKGAGASKNELMLLLVIA